MPAKYRFDDAPLTRLSPVAVLVEATELAGYAGFSVAVLVVQGPARLGIVWVLVVDLRVGGVVQMITRGTQASSRYSARNGSRSLNTPSGP
ncbi:hypothetical protein HMPREF3173_05665 [Pseudomonas sp. HMSC08G10]|nr:hypothetical protein HMPREF3173_05665 [Pseudomonas sp. HMSC08G10]